MKKNEKGLDKLLDTADVKKHDPKDETIESMRQMAWMTRVKYDELIKQGFNPDQAVELCKNLLSMNYTSYKGE